MQPKLLRVLEEKCFETGGREQAHPLRLPAHRRHQPGSGDAHRPWAVSAKTSTTGSTSFQPQHIPPLRERPEDVAPAGPASLWRDFARRQRLSRTSRISARGHGGPHRPFLAGQRPRTVECPGKRALLARHGEEIEMTDLPFVPRQSRPFRPAAETHADPQLSRRRRGKGG
jgi:hypothetical protein